MTANQFQSALASAMNDFVAFKQLEGYQYAAGSVKHLQAFDRFLVECGFDKPYLTTEILQAYLADATRWQPSTQGSRLASVRVFCRYLRQHHPQSPLLRPTPKKKKRRPARYYLYEDAEIALLRQAAAKLRPLSSLRPHTYHTLIGLLYVTGIRIDEALSLDLTDVGLDDKLLTVRQGKFGKDRLLPLTDSTVEALRAYLEVRKTFGFTDQADPFFVSRAGQRLPYSTAADNFHRLIQRCGIGPDPPRAPRLHDRRHTFASRGLRKWYREGKDVNAMLPRLATYMGHVDIKYTEVYLHVCGEVLAHANRRFQDAFPLQMQAE